MLYKITVFREVGNKRKWMYSSEVRARDATAALERACVRLAEDRIIEIRQMENPFHEIQVE